MTVELPQLRDLDDEVFMYIVNDGQIYRSQTTCIIDRLRWFKMRKKYDHHKAVRAFKHLADRGCKEYHEKFMRNNGLYKHHWYGCFPVLYRERLANHLLDYYDEALRLGDE